MLYSSMHIMHSAFSAAGEKAGTMSDSKLTPVLLKSVGFTSLLGSLLGYDIGIISGAIIFIDRDLSLSSSQAEVIVGSLNLISAVGGLCAGAVADRIGRKGAIGIASSLFIVGTACMVLSSTFVGLLVGRMVMGLGVGCGFVVGPLYAAELAPPAVRGRLASLFEVAIGCGILLGYLVAFTCRDLPLGLGWRVMLGCGGAPPLLVLLCLVALPESPRYLWAVGRRQAAREVLALVMAPGEVDGCCDEIEQSVQLTLAPQAAARELLCPRSRVVRRMALIGFGVSVSQQANGSEAVVYYMPTILAAAGVGGADRLLAWTVAVGACRTLLIAVGCLLVDRWGRRPLLLASTAGVAGSLFTLGLGLLLGARGLALTVLGLCGFMGSYAVGLGPINMVLLSEIFPFRLRATAMSLALCANRLVSGCVAISFLSLTEALTPAGAFGLFGAIATASFAFVLRLVPETKGRSLEEMEGFFEQLVFEQQPTASAAGGGVDREREKRAMLGARVREL